MAKPRNKKYVQKYQGTKVHPLLAFSEDDVKLEHNHAIKALVRLSRNVGSLGDWCDLTCRLLVGREIAVKFFKEDAVAEFIHNTISQVITVYSDLQSLTSETWSITNVEISQLNDAIDYIMEMQTKITRRQYLAIFKEVSVKKVDDSLLEVQSWADFKLMHKIT